MVNLLLLFVTYISCSFVGLFCYWLKLNFSFVFDTLFCCYFCLSVFY